MEGEGRPEHLVMGCAQEMMEEIMEVRTEGMTWERTEGTAQELQDVVEAPEAAAAGPDLLLAPHA